MQSINGKIFKKIKKEEKQVFFTFRARKIEQDKKCAETHYFLSHADTVLSKCLT